ncbi:hypothetical protein ACFWIB_10945 [Streptomyces sp. NPDC127051]|uniref:hypothetical protein n=1 Tax=Streptomyces sp. NPDC127051 TaxID=3347119 RepID=UPI00364A0B29
MLTFVVDSNALEPIAYLPGAYGVVRYAVDDGGIELLYPHAVIDELAAIPDLERRRRLLLALVSLGRLVPSGGFALDRPRFEQARLSGDAVTFGASRAGSDNNTRDALIAVTAAFEQRTLVTGDEALVRKAQALGIDTMLPLVFLARLGFEVDTF